MHAHRRRIVSLRGAVAVFVLDCTELTCGESQAPILLFFLNAFTLQPRSVCSMPSSCEGPCLRHCQSTPLLAGLAYVAIGYMGASLLYLVIVAVMDFGTPFNDSLSAEQQRIKKGSASKRRAAFSVGVLVMVLLLSIQRPLRLQHAAS